jgi:Tol biopolymer transport system component
VAEIFFTAKPLNSEVPGIYAILPDGSGFREIVKNGILYSRPSKSRLIAFLRNSPTGNDSIVLVNIDGSGMLGVINERVSRTSLTFPVLSPDGLLLAFQGRDNTGNHVLSIHWISRGETNEKSLRLSEGTLPSFSPDSKYLAFFEDNVHTGEMMLKVIDPYKQLNFDVYPPMNTGYRIKSLIHPPLIDWSSDALEIVYAMATADSSRIFIARIDQSLTKVLKLDELGAINPVLRPITNDLIAFVSKKGDIYTAKPDEENPDFLELLRSDVSEFYADPQWSPDGEKMILNNYSTYDTKEGASMILFDTKNKIPAILSSKNVNPQGFWKR